jgi:hypothetical protein
MTDNITSIDPITAAIAQAEKEMAEELSKGATRQLLGKLRQIADAKRIVANLELEYAALQRDLRAQAR